MSENRRVVVTGIGAITPLGNNTAETWNGLKNGKTVLLPLHFLIQKNSRQS